MDGCGDRRIAHACAQGFLVGFGVGSGVGARVGSGARVAGGAEPWPGDPDAPGDALGLPLGSIGFTPQIEGLKRPPEADDARCAHFTANFCQSGKCATSL
jgi:hypothetical protein